MASNADASQLSLTTALQTINEAGATLGLASAEEAARSRGLKLSLAVVDSAGNLLAFKRMDGAAFGTIDASIRKAHTAARTGAPSKMFHDLVQAGSVFLLAFDAITPAEGGVPVLLNGVCVGAVGASGGSGEDDDSVARHAAAALTAALERP
jgi:glc operon protein GlcG